MKDCLMHADISPFTGRPEKGDEISRVIKRFWVIGQKVCVTNPNKLENL